MAKHTDLCWLLGACTVMIFFLSTPAHADREITPALSARANPTRPPTALQPGPLGSSTCPVGYHNVLRGPDTMPSERSVSYASLRALGWDTPPSRSRSTNTSATIHAADFWAVLCSGNATHISNKRACWGAGPPAGVGAVHMRCDCADATLWVLLYVWRDTLLTSALSDFWAVSQCGPACTARDNMFLEPIADDTFAVCGVGCQSSTTTGSNSTCARGACPCCQGIWPVTDGTAGWVGWLAKSSVTLLSGGAVTHDRLMLQLTLRDTCGTGNMTASTPNGFAGNASPGVCFSCPSPVPPELPVQPGPLPEPPADAGITASPGLTIALGTSHNHTFTVTANGPGTSHAVSVRITLPGYPRIGYQSVSIASSAGADTVCDDPLSSDDSTGVLMCFVGDLVPSDQVNFTVTFTTAATGNFTPILGELVFPELGNPYDDILASNNTAETWINVMNCPVYQAIVGDECLSAICDPCPELNPTVYLSTGINSDPPNGLWQVRNWQVGNMSLVAEFLCVIELPGPMGDIAVLHGGDIAVLDTAGNLRYIPQEFVPPPSLDFNTVCATKPMTAFSAFHGYTGLSASFRSDMLIANTGSGHAIPLIMSLPDGGAGAPLNGTPPVNTVEQPILFPCWFDSKGAPVDNTGGTDITPGPGGSYYRWCSKDAGMNYTGTVYKTSFESGLSKLTGTAELVSAALMPQPSAVAPFGNAGAFCTSNFAVGTGAYTKSSDPDPLQGSFAGFWVFGTSDTHVTSRKLPAAPLVARTLPVVGKDGAVRINGLRVNGAAVKPNCRFPGL